MAHLDSASLARLKRVVALLASPMSGEASAAAAKATEMLHRIDMDWATVVERGVQAKVVQLRPRPEIHSADDMLRKGPPHWPLARWLLERQGSLSEHDREFVVHMVHRVAPNDEEELCLLDIADALGGWRAPR